MEKSESKNLIDVAEPDTGSYESLEKQGFPPRGKEGRTARMRTSGCRFEQEEKETHRGAMRDPSGEGTEYQQSDEGLVRKHQMSSSILGTDLGPDVF